MRPYLLYTGLVFSIIFCPVLVVQASQKLDLYVLSFVIMLLFFLFLYWLTRSEDDIINERLERFDDVDDFSFDFDESDNLPVERTSRRSRFRRRGLRRQLPAVQADAPRSPAERRLYQLGNWLRDWLDIYRDVPRRVVEENQSRTGRVDIENVSVSNREALLLWLLLLLALWLVPVVVLISLFEYNLLFVITALIIPMVIGYLFYSGEQDYIAQHNNARPEETGPVLTGLCVVLLGCTLALNLPLRYRTLAIAGLLLYFLMPFVLRFVFNHFSPLFIGLVISVVYSVNSLLGAEALHDTDRMLLVIPILQITLILVSFLVALVRNDVTFPLLFKQNRQNRWRSRNQDIL